MLSYEPMTETILFFQRTSWDPDNLKQNGLTETANRLGWRVQLITTSDLNEKEIQDLLSFWHPLGCVIDCGNRKDIPQPTLFGKVPVIYLDCRQGLFGKKANYVSHDANATVRLCARELLMRNTACLAYVGHYRHHYWSEERKLRFTDIINAHGLPLKIYAPAEAIPELSFRNELEAFLRNIPKPCGILSVNDEIGEITIVAANRLGLRIPDEVAVISIDNNLRICESLTPTLSSVAVDFFRAGQQAAELLEQIGSRSRAAYFTKTFGPIELIRRASSRPILDSAAAAMTEHIRKNAFTSLKAEAVKSLTQGSKRNAEKRFRKATGHSIMDEIHLIRLEKAKTLLAKSNYPVSEISSQCGYASESYFRKLFHRETGLSPLKFRKGLQGHT